MIVSDYEASRHPIATEYDGQTFKSLHITYIKETVVVFKT